MNPIDRDELQRCYAIQRAALDAELDASGEDVFVSPVDIVQFVGGTELAYCTWAEGVRSWLPRVECIALVSFDGPAQPPALVSREVLLSVCGAILTPVAGLEPPRDEPVRWPTPAEMTELRRRAVLGG